MGVQGLSAKTGKGRLGRLRQKRRFGAESGPVDRITQERMPDRGQMDANLVGPAGLKPAG